MREKEKDWAIRTIKQKYKSFKTLGKPKKTEQNS